MSNLSLMRLLVAIVLTASLLAGAEGSASTSASVLVGSFDENYAVVNYGTWGTTEADCMARQAVCHANGNQVTEIAWTAGTNTLEPNILEWESDPAGNANDSLQFPPWVGGTFTWYGPFTDLAQGSYMACFVMKDVTPGETTAEIYVDVKSSVSILVNADGTLAHRPFNSSYGNVCLPFGSNQLIPPSLPWNQVEFRVKVNTGKVRIDRVDLFRVLIVVP